MIKHKKDTYDFYILKITYMYNYLAELNINRSDMIDVDQSRCETLMKQLKKDLKAVYDTLKQLKKQNEKEG